MVGTTQETSINNPPVSNFHFVVIHRLCKMKFHLLLFVANLCLLHEFCSCENKVEQAFTSNEVVPDVVPTAPSKQIEVKYTKSKKEVSLGNEIAPIDVKEIPEVHFEADKESFYTLAMVDPDAPSRKNPIRRAWHHWLVVNIPGSDVAKGETLSEYVGSGPPKDTGLHRYVFLVYKQPGKVAFDEPQRSSSHGSTRGEFSIKNFAEKYKLGNPIAGNFYQAQFDDSVPAIHKQLTS